MSFSDVVKVAAAIIASLGGGGAIVFLLSGYLGKIWADRGLERQKHEYSQLNIALQSQLDIASRRLQVELDALGLVHKPRTQEEFARLSALWKRVATLRNYYGAVAQKVQTFVFAGSDSQAGMEGQFRGQFVTSLNDAQALLAEEALFIPKNICDTAQEAISAASEEVYNFAAFSPFLGTATVPTNHPDMYLEMSQKYKEARGASFNKFSEAAERLEELMRLHIGGGTSTPTSESSVLPA